MHRGLHNSTTPTPSTGSPCRVRSALRVYEKPVAGASLAALLAGLAVTCAHAPEKKKSRTDNGPGRVMSLDPDDLAAHMAVHDAQGVAMRDAVVRGDLNDLVAPAQWIAEHMTDQELPPDWREPVRSMRATARTVAGSDNLVDAARSLAELAGTCARCHESTSGPKVYMTDPPTKTTDVRGRMMRHIWATDRMWDGIVGPSETAWKAGSEVLADAPLDPTDLAPAGTLPDDIGELAKRVHTLGLDAHRASTRVEQVQIYGELLGTCAICHRALRRGP